MSATEALLDHPELSEGKEDPHFFVEFAVPDEPPIPIFIGDSIVIGSTKITRVSRDTYEIRHRA